MTALNVTVGPGAAAPGPTAARRRRWVDSPWVGFAIKRTAGLAATFVVLIVVTFLIVPLIPGDPAVAAAGPDATPERIAALRAELGLDDHPWTRFVDYVAAVFAGGLGRSFTLGIPVSEIIATRLPFTALLAVAAIVVVLLVSVPLGMLVGVLTRGGRRRTLDSVFSYLTGLVASIPPYVMATLLVVVFAIWLAVLPPAYSRNQPGLSWILPVLALAIGPICTVSRIVRRETAVTLEQDYIRTARGWRIPALRLYVSYALPNLLTSTLTLTGLLLTSMLGGAVIVETVFGWPGLGLGIVQAIITKDYPVIQGIIIVLGMLAALLTLLVDVLLGIVDERTLGGSHG